VAADTDLTSADRPRTRSAAVVAATVSVPLAIGSALLWWTAGTVAPALPSSPIVLPWPLLLTFFAIAQIAPMHIQVGRHYRSMSLTEVPFVLGLLFLSPGWFVIARTVGGISAELVVRRQYRMPVKLAFNSVLFGSEAVLGAALFRLLDDGRSAHDPLSWVAATGAIVLVSAVTGLAVAALVELLDDTFQLRRIAVAVRDGVPHAFAVVSVGVVIALSILTSRWAVVPLVLAVGALLLAYRAYASLVDRHSALERLYGFVREMSAEPDTAAVTKTLLDQAQVILHAERARVVFMDGRGEAELTANGNVERAAANWLDVGDGWIIDHVVRARRSLLLARDSRDLAAHSWLRRSQLGEAMLAPIQVTPEVGAVLVVADRIGDIRGFDPSDLLVLETLANQAAVEYRNGELVDRLRYESLHDSVTGAPNRAHLEATLDQRLRERGAAHGDRPLGLAMITLDAVQQINDSFGHQRGDDILREAVGRLATMAASGTQVFYFSGGELAVLIIGPPTVDAIQAVMRQLLSRLTEPIELEGMHVDLGTHAGLALAPAHADESQDLIKRADIAMYSAKASGNELTVYDPQYDTSSPARLALVAALRQAISNRRIEIAVQPKADLATGRIVGVEALARWTEPDRGAVSPATFIPLAEESGLIRSLTELVLDRALEACAGWQRAAPGVGVAVNVSARLLHDTEIETMIRRSLRRHRVPAALLTLEVTESTIMGDSTSTRELLDRLCDSGIAVSVDDFGTGYSSLAQLRRLPVHELKIDRTFVHGMTRDRDNAAIVRAIVELAHTLDLCVVAEGAEDLATWQQLAATGVDVGQGYFLARPMPVSEFADWFAARHGDQAPVIAQLR
jgi:diguanylate cyclase (GGDEF)-like protein